MKRIKLEMVDGDPSSFKVVDTATGQAIDNVARVVVEVKGGVASCVLELDRSIGLDLEVDADDPGRTVGEEVDAAFLALGLDTGSQERRTSRVVATELGVYVTRYTVEVLVQHKRDEADGERCHVCGRGPLSSSPPCPLCKGREWGRQGVG